jgi:acid phosphatase
LKEANWPAYGSYIIFELFQDKKTSQNFVRSIYNGKAVTLPCCNSQFCPLETFQKFVEPTIPKDYINECQSKLTPEQLAVATNLVAKGK